MSPKLYLVHLFFTDVLWIDIILNPFCRWRRAWDTEKIVQVNRSSGLHILCSSYCSIRSLSWAGYSDRNEQGKSGFSFSSWIYSKCPFNDKVLLCGDLNNKESLKNLNVVVTEIGNFKLTWICAIKTMYCSLGFKSILKNCIKTCSIY